MNPISTPLLEPSQRWDNRGRESERPMPYRTETRVSPSFEWNESWTPRLRTAEKVKVGDIIVSEDARETYDVAYLYIIERVNKKSITVYPCDQYGYRTSQEKKILKETFFGVLVPNSE